LIFEILEDFIKDKPLKFFSDLSSDMSLRRSRDYKVEVKDLHKDQLTASLMWFQNMSALNAADVLAVEEARVSRNGLIHEMPNVMFGKAIDEQSMMDLLHSPTKFPNGGCAR
jgi:hypothetical protein